MTFRSSTSVQPGTPSIGCRTTVSSTPRAPAGHPRRPGRTHDPSGPTDPGRPARTGRRHLRASPARPGGVARGEPRAAHPVRPELVPTPTASARSPPCRRPGRRRPRPAVPEDRPGAHRRPTDRLRICANETCRWVFYDDSRTGRRKWCDMSTCGNRAKAARHRARQGEAAEVDRARRTRFPALSPRMTMFTRRPPAWTTRSGSGRRAAHEPVGPGPSARPRPPASPVGTTTGPAACR